MNAAAHDAEQDAALLRLAAGGFRDMTRVAAGHPGIWPDICADNAPAIVAALDRLRARTFAPCATAWPGRTAPACSRCSTGPARPVGRSRPRATRPERLAELRVPVPDREGVLAEITTLAGDLGINIYDIEIAHSSEGPAGCSCWSWTGVDAAKLRHAIVGRRATGAPPRTSVVSTSCARHGSW